MRLVLWDLDHTLLELNRLHYHLYTQAFEKVFAQPVVQLPVMSGRTDRDSTEEFLARHHIEPTEEAVQRFWRQLVAEFVELSPPIEQWGGPVPGAQQALAALAEHDDIYQSVLTGNIRELAERKLRAFGFDQYLDFDIGGYGEDHTDRAQIIPICQQRATKRHGITFDGTNTVIIGDTPNDVLAARRAGAISIAVATGDTPADQLHALGANRTFSNLRDTKAFKQTVRNIA